MDPATARTMRKAGTGLAQLVVALVLLLFLPAGTLRFVEGSVFLAVFFGASLAITLYLAKTDVALLERRTQAGPIAEKERSQKIIQGFASFAFASTIRCPGSRSPLALVPSAGGSRDRGRHSVALGFVIVFLVFRENTYTSSVIEVAAEQRVIDTGPYAVVRHPMYLGGLVLIAGVPLALGSLVGTATFVPFAGVIVWRLLNEERFLVSQLPGYAAYRAKVRFRLIPHVRQA